MCGQDVPVTRRRQKKGGGVIIWVNIVNKNNIGPFKDDEGVKLKSVNYCEFLDQTFFEGYKHQPRSFKTKYMFKHYSVQSHTSRLNRKFLERIQFADVKIMEWPLSSPSLTVNPIENHWLIAKQKLCERDKHNSHNVELLDAIQIITADVWPEQIGKVINSMDNRLVTLTEKKNRYIRVGVAV